jgi:hypothetical protein
MNGIRKAARPVAREANAGSDLPSKKKANEKPPNISVTPP